MLSVGCTTESEYRVVNGAMLGTRLHIISDSPCDTLYRGAMALDREAKASMSIFDEQSLLNRINRGETDSLDRHITYNICLADSIHRLSGGAYDITVKPLVEAWGFAGRSAEQQPNIDSLLAFVGMEKIRIEGGRLIKSDSRVALDLNSIAKGYTVDLLADYVEQTGAENYLVDIGGEVRCKGRNRQGNPWRIGVESPYDGNMTDGEYIERRIALTAGAMATSGNYRRFYLDQKGNKIAHTIDPRTGRSQLSRLLSTTVVAPTCAEADAICTMLLAMGDEAACRFLEAHPEVAAYLILAADEGSENEFDEVITPAMQALMM
ncbi:MAG: FAD:protein FMN transferase [Rikenellaceae bacterium]|nr:FAD:protein FMN transferase [Rikenellaceae bacterium]